MFFVLLGKQIRDSRWLLGIFSTAFFSLSWLTVFMAHRFETLLAKGEGGSSIPRRLGFLRGLGGAAMDYSTPALEICWWNHPFIVLTILGWAISRGSGAVGGEIERGTLDLTLSRPVPRWMFLASQISGTLFGLALLSLALILGNRVGTQFNFVKNPPGVELLIRPALLVFALGWSVFGYTLPFSVIDGVRWRSGLMGVALTLLGLISLSIAPQLGEEWSWLEKLTVFQWYAPMTAAIKNEDLLFNVSILGTIGLTGVVIAFLSFQWRDLPSSS